MFVRFINPYSYALKYDVNNGASINWEATGIKPIIVYNIEDFNS